MYDVRLPNIDWLGQRGDLDWMRSADPSKEQGLILFYGDSSFSRWKEKYHHRPLEQEIRRKDGSQACLNHGFGTSTAEELLYYYDQLVKPWNPRALVVQASGNDRGAGYDAGEVMFLQSRLLDWARHDFPGIRLYLCDRRPTATPRTPSGRSFGAEYNELVRAYCARHDDTTLVCHADCAALFEPGFQGDYDHPRRDIFVEDQVHYNQAGYDIYRDFFRKVLDDIL